MSDPIAALFEACQPVPIEARAAVFRTGDPVQSMFLVLEGDVHLLRHTAGGTSLLLSRAVAGNVLAEASAYSAQYHCDGVATVRSVVKRLPVAVFTARLRSDPDMAEAWAARLARALQNARLESEIRSLKTVAERLDAWLGEANALPPRGQIQDLARQLGVSREALYRELARRRA